MLGMRVVEMKLGLIWAVERSSVILW